MQVKTRTAVNRLNKKIDFLQPVFETITNSLEAGSNKIKVFFKAEKVLEGITPKIIGFSIEDNGIGFNKKNREAFEELWTTNKMDLGCKGIGRLTWLKVFDKVNIESLSAKEKTDIHFHKDFDEKKDIKVEDIETSKKQTIINFQSVSTDYHKVGKTNAGTIDKRKEADLDKLYDAVEKHLLVKLSLLKKEGKKFNIALELNGDTRELTNDNMTPLELETFSIEDENSNKYNFGLHYSFLNNGKKQRDLFYCANNRAVHKFTDNVSLAKLQSDDSIIMLLTSDYLDKRVNDERNEFALDLSQNNSTLDDPLTFPKINQQLKGIMSDLVLSKYPEMEEDNQKELEDAIDEAPYLAKYIREDKSIIKNKNDLLKHAQEVYETDKNQTQKSFAALLKKKEIDPDIFYKAIGKVQDIAARELAQYFLYRQQIIDCLEKYSKNNEESEKLIHQLFMATKSESEQEGSLLNIYDSNLWLLDDKFLSYNYAASDKQINTILDKLELERPESHGDYRPDISLFYSNKLNSDDVSCVLIELKPFGINYNKKFAGLSQIRDYVNLMSEKNENIKDFWVYVITKIDEEFSQKLKEDDYIPLFSNKKGHKVFVKYYGKTRIPIYLQVICVDAVIQDAKSRNKVFLEIIKES